MPIARLRRPQLIYKYKYQVFATQRLPFLYPWPALAGPLASPLATHLATHLAP